MAKKPPEMTPAEFNVMKVLWRLKHGSVAEVRAEHTRIHGTEFAYTTVMTLLNRLATKGALRVDKSRQPFLYKPAFRRDSVLRDRLRQFVDTVFDGNADSLVLHLLEDESLTSDELRRIERMLQASSDSDEASSGEDEK